MAVEPNVRPDSAVSSNPYYMLANDLAWRRERSGWSLGAEYRPLPWLFVRAATSRDRAWENASEVLPANPFGPVTRGFRDTERQSVTDASLGARSICGRRAASYAARGFCL